MRAMNAGSASFCVSFPWNSVLLSQNVTWTFLSLMGSHFADLGSATLHQSVKVTFFLVFHFIFIYLTLRSCARIPSKNYDFLARPVCSQVHSWCGTAASAVS